MKRCRPDRKAFTLIELLVVMGIIGILIALLFPAVKAIRSAAMKAEAQHGVKSLETAIKSYQVDYGRFPMQVSGTEAQHLYTVGEYAQLVNALRGIHTEQARRDNPKKTVYLDLAENKLLDGRMVDPWDQPYQVCVDYDQDNQITIAPRQSEIVRGHSVVVWSMGEDKLSTTASNRLDDVISWGN